LHKTHKILSSVLKSSQIFLKLLGAKEEVGVPEKRTILEAEFKLRIKKT
jgi:hypothetical protein